MRKISKFLLFISMILALASCDIIITTSSQASSSSQQTTSTSSSSSFSTSNSSSSSTSSSSGSSSSSSNGNSSVSGTLCILSINDLHGAVEESTTSPGLSRLSTYINQQRNLYGANNVIVLDAGDSFQGTITSNLTQGRVVIDAYNQIGIDQFIIGNHEFDWGIEKVTQYCDGNMENGEANFPIANANIKHKTTKETLPGVKEYTIVEKAGLRVGIIATIGYGLESSILSTRVEDYNFEEPVEIIKNLAKKLRNEENCDIVIANTHDSGEYINSKIANFSSDSWVDAVINAHTHAEDDDLFSRDGVSLPTVEADTAGTHMGKITLTINNGKVTAATSDYVEMSFNLAQDSAVEAVIQDAVESISDIKNQELATVGQNISYKSQLYTWVGEVIRKSQNVDIAFTNQGGLRSLDGGLSSGSKITLGHLYTIMPFDNELMYCEVKGSALKNWINSYSNANIISYKSGLSKNTIDSNTTYTVCIIDFLAGKDYSQPVFQNSTYRTSGYLLRDMMIKDIQLQQAQYGNWMPNRGAIITPNDII